MKTLEDAKIKKIKEELKAKTKAGQKAKKSARSREEVDENFGAAEGGGEYDDYTAQYEEDFW